MKPKPLNARYAAFSAIAAATVVAGTPERQTDPTTLSVSIQCAFSSKANETFEYQYSITNTSPNLMIGAVSMQGKNVWGSGPGGRGWAQAPSVYFGPLTWRALGTDTALQPGRAMVDLRISSSALPGVVRLTAYPAIMPKWDEPSPAGVTVDAIGPNVGSASLEPLAAAADIVKEVRRALVGALRADGDDAGDTLERDLREALAALARVDVTAADAAIRDALAVRWQRSLPWRTSLHQALEIDLSYVLDLLGRAPDFRIRYMTAIPSSVTLESFWTYPGVPSPPPAEIPALMSETQLGLVGTIEEVAVERVDSDRSTDMRTRLRVRPREIFWGHSDHLDPVDVWLRGGVLTRDRQALSVHSTRAADTAFALKPGDVVFVTADRFSKPGSAMDGQYWIRAEDTFAIVDNGRVRPGGNGSPRWINAVIQHGVATNVATSQSTEADIFLATIRHEVK